MAYQALYRKYRPSNFDEVVGQTHIIQTLKMRLFKIVLHMLIYFVVLEVQEKHQLQKYLRRH